LPSRVDIDSVDRFSGVLHAQMIILPLVSVDLCAPYVGPPTYP
jgi:hypothetical protein